jgi:hypothetical protein
MDCWHCGEPLPDYSGMGRPARYCSPTCRDRAFRVRRDELVRLGLAVRKAIEADGVAKTLNAERSTP